MKSKPSDKVIYRVQDVPTFDLSKVEFIDKLGEGKHFYSKIINKKFAIKHLDLLVNKFKKIKITINKKSTFLDYSSPKRELVLYFNVKFNKKLNKLQSEISNILSEYIDKKYISKNIYRYKKNKILQKNFCKFGFPFVNKNWIPHFTIASIKNCFLMAD